ncbi:MAG: endonuclease domain-containing protein [Bdellovibrionota bacterium]
MTALPKPRIKQFSRKLRSNPTDAERLLWRHLRRREVAGFKFRRQHPIGPYITDFICLEKKLIIEVDGGQHNETPVIERDQARAEWLESEGFRVLRFWNNEVMQNAEGVIEKILETLGVR